MTSYERIVQIALNTYRESIRSKILYALFGLGILIIAVSSLFGRVSIGDQVKVIKDFGFFSISLFCMTFAVISGSALLFKELSRKTIFHILARSVHRYEFLVGKYLGLLLTVIVILIASTFGLITFCCFFENKIDWLLFQGSFYIFLEMIIICAAAIFFSSIVVTPLLGGLFTFGVFLAGRSVEHLRFFLDQGDTQSHIQIPLKTLYYILPDLHRLNIATPTVYGYAMRPDHILWSTAYACSYAAVLLIFSTFIFRSREFSE